MNKTLTSETNGHQPGHETGEEHTLTCGEEMDTEENKDSTRATLMEIMEDRSARILENQRDICAVERVLAILDARQPAGDKPAEATDGVEATDEETEGADATDEAEGTDEVADEEAEGADAAGDAEVTKATDEAEGTDATGEAEGTGPKPEDEEPKREPHTDYANLLSMPIEQLRKIANDPEASAGVFVQARGGEPLECPKCGSRALTKRVTGITPRSDLFRCTPCKTEFGIKTGTAMHNSRETLGTWLMAIRLMADTAGEIRGHDLSNLTGTGAKAAADMIIAIRSEMNSPAGWWPQSHGRRRKPRSGPTKSRTPAGRQPNRGQLNRNN